MVVVRRASQGVGLRLAASLGHGFGEVGKDHREPQPDRDGSSNAMRQREAREVGDDDRPIGHHLDHEDDGVLASTCTRIELAQAELDERPVHDRPVEERRAPWPHHGALVPCGVAASGSSSEQLSVLSNPSTMAPRATAGKKVSPPMMTTTPIGGPRTAACRSGVPSDDGHGALLPPRHPPVPTPARIETKRTSSMTMPTADDVEGSGRRESGQRRAVVVALRRTACRISLNPWGPALSGPFRPGGSRPTPP